VDDDESEDDSVTGLTSDQMHSTSHQEGKDGAGGREQADLEAEQAKQLIKIFHAETSRILSDGLMGEESHDDVANEYVVQIATYNTELRPSGWAHHKVIKAVGTME